MVKNRARIRARSRSKVGPKSRFEKPKITKLGILEVLLPCAIALLKVKSLSSLLEAIEPC